MGAPDQTIESGTEALSCLALAHLPPTRDGQCLVPVSEHLETQVGYQVYHLKKWLRSFAQGFCVVSGLPRTQCKGCQRKGALGDVSRFTKGSTDREAPHGPQLREAVFASVEQIFKLYELVT